MLGIRSGSWDEQGVHDTGGAEREYRRAHELPVGGDMTHRAAGPVPRWSMAPPRTLWRVLPARTRPSCASSGAFHTVRRFILALPSGFDPEERYDRYGNRRDQEYHL